MFSNKEKRERFLDELSPPAEVNGKKIVAILMLFLVCIQRS
jgi:hypothetical protein